MKENLRFPIGESDFQSIRKEQFEYVDKSLFIEQVIQDSARILLFPRPRRFGKTLNLSMLRYFFEKTKEERRSLFSGLQIETSKKSWEHFQKYPVMFLTFKDAKFQTWDDCLVKLSDLLSELFTTHAAIKTSLAPQEQEYFQKVLFRKALPSELSSALSFLSKHLSSFYEEKVMILVDEYDTCLHAAYEHGYEKEALSFFRNLLSGAFKDNRYLFKGVMTGILRVAKESIFSGMNNLAVYSMLHHKFATPFGFTEPEVEALVRQANLVSQLPDIKAWYNGYLFGGKTIYNPWSILWYLKQPEEGFKAYWVGTGGNELIRKILLEQGLLLETELEALLRGESIEKPILENLSFRELESSGDAVWSFLLFAGYLKLEATFTQEEKLYATLRLANQEIRQDFFNLTQSWFEQKLSRSATVEAFLKALFSGDAETVEDTLGHLLKVNVSYHDVIPNQKKGDKSSHTQPREREEEKTEAKTRREFEEQEEEKSKPEAVYHAFVLGMLVNLSSRYEVRSNRESGYGRADVMLIPKQAGKPGVIFEFKAIKKAASPEKAMKEALDQLEENEYQTELVEKCATPIFEYAAVFSGKKVFVKVRTEKSPKQVSPRKILQKPVANKKTSKKTAAGKKTNK